MQDEIAKDLQRPPKQFIAWAYNLILCREPDESGLEHYLLQLSRGYSRLEVVAQLVRSSEAKALERSRATSTHRSTAIRQLMLAHRLERGIFPRPSSSLALERRINMLALQVENLTKTLSAAEGASRKSFDPTIETPPHAPPPSAAAHLRPAPEATSLSLPPEHCSTATYPVVRQVPKILHRVYFDNYPPYRDPFRHFLETWRHQLPHYQIIEWGPDNVDTSSNEWLRRSAAARDPVFLSEFVRWDALSRYGGAYLDADCEVLNGALFDQLVDELENSQDFDVIIGVEDYENGNPTAQTVIAKRGANLVRFMHNLYTGALSGPLWHWRAERGLIGPQLISLYLREHGLEKTKGFPTHLSEPIVIGRVKIYPQDWFSPKFTTTGKKLFVTQNTCIYHLFANQNVTEVDPEAEFHRKNPMRFDDYCSYLDGLSHHLSPPGSKLPRALPPRHHNLKRIHRIYFGFDGKPDPYKRYLQTWARQLPNYEIHHWDASNLPMDICEFSRLMYERRDHAFLTDYFRWWVLRNHGGIYLDADVEVVSGALFDRLISELEEDDKLHAFIGIDNKEEGWYTAHSVACKRRSPLATFMCEVYEKMDHLAHWQRKIFYFMAPQLTALYFTSRGFNRDGMGALPNLESPSVIDGVKIYPQEWFSPIRPQLIEGKGAFVIDAKTSNTCLCHHFSCSWHEPDSPYARANQGPNGYALLDELLLDHSAPEQKKTTGN